VCDEKPFVQTSAAVTSPSSATYLHTTTTSETTNGGLGDTLNVVTKDLTVTLGAALSETFASFTTSRHVEFLLGLLDASKLLEIERFVAPKVERTREKEMCEFWRQSI
jgi:hypothetical protein